MQGVEVDAWHLAHKAPVDLVVVELLLAAAAELAEAAQPTLAVAVAEQPL